MKTLRKKLWKYGRNLCMCAILALLFAFTAGVMDAQAYVNTVGIVKEGTGARIRLEASTSSTVLASVAGGSKVEICGKETGSDGYTWYKVYINGNTIGYIRSDLVTDTGEKTGGIADDNLQGGSVGGGGTGGNTSTATPTPADDPGEGGNGDEDQTGGDDQMGTQQPIPPAQSSNAALYACSVSEGTLMPAFSPEITQYTVFVGADTTEIYASGTPESETAVISENYGFSKLVKGSNMAVITVQAEDGTRRSYLFTINRGEASEEIRYAVPGTVESMQTGGEEGASKKGSSHVGLLIFLVLVILVMAAVLVMMGLRIRDYRRDLYGEDAQEFSLREAIPLHRIFTRKKSTGKRSRTRDYDQYDEDDEEEEDEDEEEDDEDSGSSYSSYSSYSVSESASISPVSTGSLAGVVRDWDRQDSYSQDSEEDEELDEDELEDITEREATLNDRVNGKEVWKSVNFMTPSDDLEFEFLDLEDNE